MQSLLDLDEGNYDEVFLEADFINMVKDHKEYLRNLTGTEVISLEPATSYRWRGDFYGLLNDLGINPNYRLPVCIVNGLASYSDWDGETDVVIVPSEKGINDLVGLYITSKN